MLVENKIKLTENQEINDYTGNQPVMFFVTDVLIG